MKNTKNLDKQTVDTDGAAKVAKWFWKMNYCKKHGLAPAQNQVWDYVEKKWQEQQAKSS